MGTRLLNQRVWKLPVADIRVGQWSVWMDRVGTGGLQACELVKHRVGQVEFVGVEHTDPLEVVNADGDRFVEVVVEGVEERDRNQPVVGLHERGDRCIRRLGRRVTLCLCLPWPAPRRDVGNDRRDEKGGRRE